MALLKDLIVTGASKFIGDAYFNTIKAGVWNGTPIDLSHGGTAGTTTANKILLSTSTSGTSAWSSWNTAGFLKTSTSGVISIDTNTYITGNLTITLSGDISGSGTTAITTSYSGTVPINKGGTNKTSWTLYGIVYADTASSLSLITLPTWSNSTLYYIKCLTNSSGVPTYSLQSVDTAVTSNSANLVTSGAVYSAILAGFNANNAIVYKGTYTATASGAITLAKFSTPPGTSSLGWMWMVTGVSGSVQYFGSTIVENGDLIISNNANPGTTESNYYIILKNIDPQTYVTLAGVQTITGAKTFTGATVIQNTLEVTGTATFTSNIVGNLTGNASTADRLSNTTAVGNATTPVYFSGGLPVACTSYANASVNLATTANNIKVTLDEGTNTDYSPTWVKVTANSNSTAVYISPNKLKFNSSTGLLTAYQLQVSSTDATNGYKGASIYGVTTITHNTYGALKIVRYGSTNNAAIKFYNGSDGTTYLGSIAMGTANGKLKRWKTDESTSYDILDTSDSSVNGNTIKINGTSTTWTDTKITTNTAVADTTYYLISKASSTDADNSTGFVDAKAYMTNGKLFSNDSEVVNLIDTLTIAGNKTFSGSTQIDSLTAGNLTVNGYATIATSGSVLLGTVVAGAWHGTVIDVPYGGTGATSFTANCVIMSGSTTTSPLTTRAIADSSSAAAIGTSTNLVTERDVYYGLPTINNAHTYNSGSTYYAPTAGGATGTVLIGAGTTSAPTWLAANTTTTKKVLTSTGTGSVGNNPIWETIELYNSSAGTSLIFNDQSSETGHLESLNSSKWVSTGITLRTLDLGSYMLQIVETTEGKAAVYSGFFSNYASASELSSVLDEIPLHVSSSQSSPVRIYAATLNGILYVSSQDSTEHSSHSLTFKYKRII